MPQPPPLDKHHVGSGAFLMDRAWLAIDPGAPLANVASMAKKVFLCALLPGLFLVTSASAQSLAITPVQASNAGLAQNANTPARLARFGKEPSSVATQKLADWVVHSADNGKLPFIIIDKVQARVFVFDAQGELFGATSALLGLAVGDHSVPGIGQRKLSSIRPDERTTPAGRFVASLGKDLQGQEVLWVDYDTAVSLHPVVTGTPKERRAERLASLSPLDKRISYGCINVPRSFYEKVVSPVFTRTYGVVYVLPEIRSAQEVFGSYDVPDSQPAQVQAAPIQTSSSAPK